MDKEQSLYLPGQAELVEARRKAKEICYDFNLLRPSDEEGQKQILTDLLGSVSSDFHILSPFWCDYGYYIHLGENFFANHNLVILDCAPVTFGDNVMIGPNCGFYTAGHPMDPAVRREGWEYALPITVGNDVWIGAGTHVLPGVHIGNNVVIGAGSVVSKDLPDNVVAVGNPCRVIRQLPPEGAASEKEGQ